MSGYAMRHTEENHSGLVVVVVEAELKLEKQMKKSLEEISELKRLLQPTPTSKNMLGVWFEGNAQQRASSLKQEVEQEVRRRAAVEQEVKGLRVKVESQVSEEREKNKRFNSYQNLEQPELAGFGLFPEEAELKLEKQMKKSLEEISELKRLLQETQQRASSLKQEVEQEVRRRAAVEQEVKGLRVKVESQVSEEREKNKRFNSHQNLEQ
ncbi:hypothetical protein WMY93_008834 [Mugilogobius chulae]|uniref:Uncharacterized protein n=1 Tax=Mugilogobius chulae TaxID=88201 RepID=A0AAW0PD51_9GOBI